MIISVMMIVNSTVWCIKVLLPSIVFLMLLLPVSLLCFCILCFIRRDNMVYTVPSKYDHLSASA